VKGFDLYEMRKVEEKKKRREEGMVYRERSGGDREEI
jgi:hypothetical protein